MMLVGIETGGTKVVCAAGSAPLETLDVQTIPTTTPAETLTRIGEFVARYAESGRLDAVGIGTFGPVDLDPRSATYGYIGATPKHGWQGAPVLQAVRDATSAPVAIDTDVTAAALGELRWGAGAGHDHLAYATIGTGVGVGAIVDGKPLHGAAHPEFGHLTVRRHPDDDFAGVCRLHGDCLEGLASGPSISQRWQRPGDDLGPMLGRAIEVEACYLAQLATALAYLLSPQRIVLGGGVMHTPGLLDAVRVETARLLAGALGADHPASNPSSDFVCRPQLGNRAGVVGALTMALDLAVAGTR